MIGSSSEYKIKRYVQGGDPKLIYIFNNKFKFVCEISSYFYEKDQVTNHHNKVIKNFNKEPLIKADTSVFWRNIFYYAFFKMAKKSFFAMRVKNAVNFEKRDKNKPTIFFACHCSWWDGPIAYILCRGLLKTDMQMMIEELYRFPLLSRIGGFSVEKASPTSSLKALNYCLSFLQESQKSLWIFPQGSVLPPDHRPIKFAGGISYLCKKLKGVNLIPIAHRYNFLRENRPELLIEIGKPIILGSDYINRKNLTAYLENEFTIFLDKQRQEISSGNLAGYEFFFKSRLCVAKLIEKYFTSFVRSFKI